MMQEMTKDKIINVEIMRSPMRSKKTLCGFVKISCIPKDLFILIGIIEVLRLPIVGIVFC